MKKATVVLLAMALGVFGLSGCRARTTSSLQTSVSPAAAVGDYVVIGSFARRDQVVTVKTGPNGIVYTVAGRDGKVQFENLTTAQFKEKTPRLHEYMETSTAQWGGLQWPTLPDAGIR